MNAKEHKMHPSTLTSSLHINLGPSFFPWCECLTVSTGMIEHEQLWESRGESDGVLVGER